MTRLDICNSFVLCHQELFAAQLQKHDALIGQIDVYLTAQPKILDALTKVNVDFVPIRQKIDLTLQQLVTKPVFVMT